MRPVEEAEARGHADGRHRLGARHRRDRVSFVATDNTKGGELAADRMGELLNGKGKVLLLRYQEGSASTTARETGFLAELKAKVPGISVISSDQYAGADARHGEARRRRTC